MKPLFTTENLKVFKIKGHLAREHGCCVDTYVALRVSKRDKFGVATDTKSVCSCEAYHREDEDAPGWWLLTVRDLVSPDFDSSEVTEFLEGLLRSFGDYTNFHPRTTEYLRERMLALKIGSPNFDQDLGRNYGQPLVIGAAE